MAGTDNSTVKITIDVVDANSGQVISTVTQNLGKMGEAGAAAGGKVAEGSKTAAAGLREAGTAAAQAADKGRRISEIGGHATTSLDQVRLLSRGLAVVCWR